MLDLACGTGVVARIAVARPLRPVSGARIRWRGGDAERLPRFDPPFDVVLCHQGFQFFRNRVKAALDRARVPCLGGACWL